MSNEAERALRHAVIARRISYGTHSTEGSLAVPILDFGFWILDFGLTTCRLVEGNGRLPDNFV